MKLSLKPNQLVNIRIEFSADRYELYPSRVEEIAELTIALAAPIYKGQVRRVAEGEEIWVEFVDGGNLYRFHTTVVRQVKEPVPLLIVMRPNKIQRWNRRKFFRFPVRLKVTLQLADQQLTGETVDLSAGGFAARFPLELEEVKKDAAAQVLLSLPEKAISSKGRIVRQEPLENQQTILAVEFTDLPEKEQDEIVAFIFAQQRELRQRGLV